MKGGSLQVQALRRVSAGQGLMLECASARLMGAGMPHHNCPDKARPQSSLALSTTMEQKPSCCMG